MNGHTPTPVRHLSPADRAQVRREYRNLRDHGTPRRTAGRAVHNLLHVGIRFAIDHGVDFDPKTWTVRGAS